MSSVNPAPSLASQHVNVQETTREQKRDLAQRDFIIRTIAMIAICVLTAVATGLAVYNFEAMLPSGFDAYRFLTPISIILGTFSGGFGAAISVFDANYGSSYTPAAVKKYLNGIKIGNPRSLIDYQQGFKLSKLVKYGLICSYDKENIDGLFEQHAAVQKEIESINVKLDSRDLLSTEKDGLVQQRRTCVGRQNALQQEWVDYRSHITVT